MLNRVGAQWGFTEKGDSRTKTYRRKRSGGSMQKGQLEQTTKTGVSLYI